MKAGYATAWLRAIKAAQTETRDPILDELGSCLEHSKDNVVAGPLYAVVKQVIRSPPQPPLTMPAKYDRLLANIRERVVETYGHLKEVNPHVCTLHE